MKLYHAAHPDYQEGEDLLSLLRQMDAGRITQDEALAIISRWDADETYLFADGSLISFAPTLAEAEEIRSIWNSGEGMILSVDTEELASKGLRVRKNAENYPAVSGGSVPGYLLTVAA